MRLLVACIQCSPPLPAAQFDLLSVNAAELRGIELLTDHTFELRLASGYRNVDAVIMPPDLLTRHAHLAGHTRTFTPDTPGLATRLAHVKPRARTPNIDFEWPGDVT